MTYKKTEANQSLTMSTIALERMSEGAFASMKDSWNALLERNVTNEVFLSWEWMFSWWNAFNDESKKFLILLGKNSQGELIGIAPFYIEKQNYFGIANRNVVRFCSSRETAADHLDILCNKEFAQSFPAAVFAYLQEKNAEWDIISFEGIKDESILKSYLLKKKDRLPDFIIECSTQSGCPYLTIDQTFEEYLNSFSGKTRNTLQRKRRLLLKKEKNNYHILNNNGDHVEKYIKELFSLHAGRARRKKILTVFSGEKAYHFHESLITSLLKDDKVVVAFLSEGATFLASYYCIKHNNKYYYYQTGISEQGEQKSAGTVLLSLMIEKAFNEGCCEFDFLRGSERYKYFWASSTRYNYSLLIYKNTFFNRIVHHLTRSVIKPGRKMLKHVYRKDSDY